MSHGYSLARLMAGITATALGMGLIATLWQSSSAAIFVGLILMWTGISLPFMRTQYAVGIGVLLAVATYMGLVMWAIGRTMSAWGDPTF